MAAPASQLRIYQRTVTYRRAQTRFVLRMVRSAIALIGFGTAIAVLMHLGGAR